MKKQSFLKGSLILMLSAVVAKVLGAAFKIPLTNLLGGVGMSYFSCAYSLFTPFYAFVSTGATSAVARLAARSAALGALDNARRARRLALLIFSACGLAGSFLVFVLAEPFSVYSAESPDAALSVAAIAPAVFFGCVAAVERGYYEGLGNMLPTALSQAIEGAVKVAAGLFCSFYVSLRPEPFSRFFPYIEDERALAAAAGVFGVTLSTVGAALFFAVSALFARKAPSPEKALMSRREISSELIRNALPIGAGAIAANLTALIDMRTIAALTPRAGASEDYPQFVYGSYVGIALTIFNLVPSVTNMLGKGALTFVASDWESGDRASLKRSSMQALLTAAAISVPAAACMAALSGEAVSFLFPRQPEEAAVCVAPLRLLAPGVIFLCLSFPVYSMLQAVGKASLPLKISIAGVGVKLAASLLLVPSMGVSGAALSTTISCGASLALALRAYVKRSGVKLDIAPFASVAYGGLVCLLATSLAASAARARDFGSFATLAIAGGIGFAAYIASAGALLRKKRVRKADSRSLI